MLIELVVITVGMGLSANVVVFVLGLVAGGNEASGWAEI